jgi:putative ABC transport system permease protein
MHAWLRRLVELVRPAQLDRESVEEMSHHVELLVERKMAAGVPRSEARRQALAEVGTMASAREQIAEDRTGFAFDQLAREASYAARVLRRSPGVTLLSIATMGLGIGASAVLFALINGIVLRPLPYPEPDRLVRIFDVNQGAGVARVGVASGNIDDWRRRAAAFDGIAGYSATGRTASFDADADVLITAQVSDDFFNVLRVWPVVGRAFSEDEFRRADFNSASAPVGADPVVLLSHSVWTERFGADPNVVGRTITLERRPFRIVGVMPAGFAVPDARVRLWLPWNIANRPRDQHYLGAVARLKPGVSLAQAEDMLNAVARDLGDEYPTTNRGWSVQLSPLATETIGDTAKVLWILLAAVGLVLLVACANVALLSLMRGLDRRQETAVRLALGASGARLMRELLLESALLAIVGGITGAAVAAAGLRVLPAITTDLPRLGEVAFDQRAIWFIGGVTILSAMLSGLPQAWRRLHAAPLAGLNSGSVRVTEGVDRHWFRNAIVVAQIAMALVLMLGSGLLVRSFLQLRATDPGFDARGVLVAPIFLDAQAYDSNDKTRTYYRTLFSKLSALPGVMAVAGATTVPTSPLGPAGDRPVWPQGSTPDISTRAPATVRVITPGYLTAMGLRLVDGRPIDDRDSPQAPRVLMISETLARRMWPGERAVGKQLVVDYGGINGTYPSEVIGVVGDVRFRGPRSEPLSEFYLPHAQRSYLILNVVVKTAGDPRTLIPSVRATLKDVDPLKPAQGLYALEDLIGATYARDRQVMITLLVFAAAAIFLAVISVYGVLSQRVRERARDIGIRMAMGASGPSVMGWVAGSGLRLIAVGLAIGAIVARALISALDGLLFGVAPTDGLTTAIAIAVLAAVGTAASLAPAWRATRIDPVQILRRD